MEGDIDYRVDPVLSVSRWETNAHMIEDMVELGYLKLSDHVLDPTYGSGKWWTRWRPEHLYAHDKKLDGSDFRDIQFGEGTFDVVAFDPPYVSTGGRTTSTIDTFNEAYGLVETPRTPRELQDLINGGLEECLRVVKVKGYVLVKCMNYVSSGKLWPGIFYTWEKADRWEARLADFFIHAGDARPQPPRTRADGARVKQQHGRANYSALLVLQRMV